MNLMGAVAKIVLSTDSKQAKKARQQLRAKRARKLLACKKTKNRSKRRILKQEARRINQVLNRTKIRG